MKQLSIIDVNAFFTKIIEGYLHFGRQASTLAMDIPSLQPEVIMSRCQQLNVERQQLSALDEQLVEILNLAGDDLSSGNQIIQYRKAFSSAVRAVDAIQGQLYSVRDSIQDITRH